MIRLDNKTCIFCLLARNVENALKRNIPKINEVRGFFHDSWVIVVENDSRDKTKELLKEWAEEKDNIILDMKDTNEETIPNRTDKCVFPAGSRYRIEKMATFRNIYLKIIKEKSLKSDYIIVIDVDIDSFYPQDIKVNIENAPEDWHGLFPNGVLYSKCFNKIIKEKYYDTFAFVPYESKTYELTFREQYENRDYISRNLKHDYLKVKSAFGGLGIYRYEDLTNFQYTVTENHRSTILEVLCEHISLAQYLENRGCSYICRNMKVLYEKAPFLSILFPAKVNTFLYPFVKFKQFPI